MSGSGTGAGDVRPGAPQAAAGTAEPEGFPRIYAAAKWTVIVLLALLALMAAAFWALLLGGFAESGFRAADPASGASEPLVITPDCAWPYDVNHHDAPAVCKMFNRLPPEQRAQVLEKRRQGAAGRKP